MSTVREATIKDLEAITEIYNEAVLQTVATFDIEPKTSKDQKLWFMNHDATHPILVAEQDGAIMGWASLSNYSDRCAYSATAEVSLYVRKEHRGRGVGRKLLRAILEEGQRRGLHTVIARITEGNAVSIRLFASEKFERVGTMKEVGRKFGRLLDVLIMQRVFNDHIN
jgi:L-amino acid N-acyltransferase YncA